MKTVGSLLTASVLLAPVFLINSAFAATSCDKLSSLSLPNTTFMLSQEVAPGAFPPPPARGGGAGRGPNFSDLPAFCRVVASLKPSPDSDISIEVWMPVPASWNGKLRGTGNGGLGGGVGANPGPLAAAVRLGYAAVGSNTGHEGDSSYAIDHPEKIKDFGYRSAHEMTVTAKLLIREYYGMSQKASYIAEGGGGTMAAFSSAQRYPADYDAVAATGIATHLSNHTFAQMWNWQAMHQEPGSLIPPAKLAVLHQAVLDACDANDGLKDGIIGDPEHCRFDPGVTLCKGSDNGQCLTAAQVEAAKKIYQGPHNPRSTSLGGILLRLIVVRPPA